MASDDSVELRLDGGQVRERARNVWLRIDVPAPERLRQAWHITGADGTSLPCRADRDAGDRLCGWVVLPEVTSGRDVELTLHAGAGAQGAPLMDVTPVGEGAFFVEAWIHVDEARAEAVQVVAASWDFAERPEAFATYDADGTDGLPTRGFFGGVFDGRWVYFSPQCNAKSEGNADDDIAAPGRHGDALRYDTHRSFDDPQAWEGYAAGETAGLTTRGYYGCLFDGRYVYYVPRFDGDRLHTRVLRYDTHGDFRDADSWTARDAGRAMSCQGGAFDGRYLYFAPGMYQEGGDSGEVLRYDTQSDFHDDASWAFFDAAATGGLECRCYDGAVWDGRHVYFVPLGKAPVLRHDPTAGFANPAAWQAFDATTVAGFDACVGAVFDGRWIHFVPYAHGTVVRYDTEGGFTDVASWEACTPGRVDGIDCVGYDGAAFDGRWVMHVPFYDGDAVAGFHARLLRYDTAGEFTDKASWQAAEGRDLAPPNPGGFNGGAFDGRFLYMCPWRQNNPAGEIRSHGQVLRLDTAGPAASFQLRWMDCGHNGGLGGSVPGPTLLVNTEQGVVNVQAHRVPAPGWHHVAGLYDPQGDAELWIDGERVGRQPARGAAITPAGVTVGRLEGGTARLQGTVAGMRLQPGTPSAEARRLTAESLREPLLARVD
jgi:hypothetical protein